MLTTELRTIKRKRTDKDPESLIESQIAYKGELAEGAVPNIPSEAGFGNSNKSAVSSSSGLNDVVASVISEYVVSLASFEGDTMLFRCSGIFIRSSCANATSILTSASLVRSDDDENRIIDNMTIKVRLPNDLIVIGWLHHYDLKYDLAVVNIERLSGFRAPNIISRSQSRFEFSSMVVSVGRCFNLGTLTITCGVEIGKLSDELCVAMSAYQINMPWIGGPLVDVDGRFFGINCCDGERAFLPWDKIVECLERSGIIRTDTHQEVDGIGKTGRSVFQYYFNVPKRNYYPFPDMNECEDFNLLRLFNSFEEEFESGIWSTLSKEVDSTLSECVVSLASFNGDARHFACTGVFIDCYPARILTSASLVRNSGDESKICDNLRIEVCLQNKSRVTAKLKYYDLRYNVAVVDIISFRCPHAIELEEDIPFAPNTDVVAVGCCFKSYKLMATKGVLVDKLSKLDCKELGTSTCKITKAGIGGPLIDMVGKFVGMNFYHEEETPYLPRRKIQELLRQFDAKWHNTSETVEKGDPFRWPVPKAYWAYPPYPLAVVRCEDSGDTLE